MLTQNLARVRARIQHACERAGRDPSSVTVVAVTKGVAVERIREAVALGLTELGENRVQEARQKQIALGWGLRAQGKDPEPGARSPEPIRWHLIGHLQRNKVKEAIQLFHMIHSVDSSELAEELERHMDKRTQDAGHRTQGSDTMEVLIQVNVSGEATKFGCPPDHALALARRVNELPHLRLRGVMTMAPFADDPEQARPHFRRLRLLRDELATAFRLPPSAFCLSMGMSGDFDIAIEEGADYVRLGTALFKESD